MYQSSHSISIDSKGRVTIPSKVRDLLLSDCGGELVVTAHTDEPCLLIYPDQEWQRLLPQIKAFPGRNKKAAKMQRLLLGYATSLTMDADNGRVSLTQPLRDFAGLEKKLMLVGMMNRFELWSEERWFAYVNEDVEDGEEPEEIANFSF